jgi:hypothetical protein
MMQALTSVLMEEDNKSHENNAKLIKESDE